jgi:hypothetical protein
LIATEILGRSQIDLSSSEEVEGEEETYHIHDE